MSETPSLYALDGGVLDEESPPADTPTDEETLAELRTLLLGPAETQIKEVHARLTDPQRQLTEVSRVLPAAIAVRTRQDDELSDALAPTLSSAINRSVRRNPQPLVDAIFPVMGPAIRKAIANALNGMIQSLNQSLSHSLSVQGLKWRFEAFRTGKSFAEVVMLHTLLYRVEEVFLIHKETGLLLQHVSAGEDTVQDADMVSGMLTAIQDFVHDSFKSDQGEQLDSLRVGELTVWVEQGPSAILAGVIHGTAPQELRAVFQSTLERIHLQHHEALAEYSGDSSAFEAARPLLEDCLQSQFNDPGRQESSKGIPKHLLIILGVVVAALLVWGLLAWRDARRWNAYVESLRREPGVVVTEVGERDGKYFVGGLRDPLSRDPQSLLSDANVEPADVISRWDYFQALTPDFVIQRARQLLDAPPSVALKLENGELSAEGFASRQWITDARRGVRFIPGVSRFKEDNLLDLERIEHPLLLFELDRSAFVPGQEQKLEQLAADIVRLQNLLEASRKRALLEIRGHTDGSGTEERNVRLAQERAEAVAEALKERLPPTRNLTITPFGSTVKLREELTDDDRATNRSVSFKITITDAQ